MIDTQNKISFTSTYSFRGNGMGWEVELQVIIIACNVFFANANLFLERILEVDNFNSALSDWGGHLNLVQNFRRTTVEILINIGN